MTWSIRHWHLKNKRLKGTKCTNGPVPVAQLMKEMPSGRTTMSDLLASLVSFVAPHLGSKLVPFSTTPRVKSWRFRALRHRQSALHLVVMHILCQCDHTGTSACKCGKLFANPDSPPPTTIVAYGAARFNPSARGNLPAPNARISRALKRIGHAVVVPMDEFRTSKLCSCCHRELSPLEKPAHPLPNDPGSQPRSYGYHGALQCTNYNCRAHGKPWNRDVNAAINMASLLLFSLSSEKDVFARPQPFTRGTNVILDPFFEWFSQQGLTSPSAL